MHKSVYEWSILICGLFPLGVCGMIEDTECLRLGEAWRRPQLAPAEAAHSGSPSSALRLRDWGLGWAAHSAHWYSIRVLTDDTLVHHTSASINKSWERDPQEYMFCLCNTNAGPVWRGRPRPLRGCQTELMIGALINSVTSTPHSQSQTPTSHRKNIKAIPK